MILYMFVEIAHEDDIMATLLMLGEKCQKVPPKVMAGIQVWPCLLNECSLLLMIGHGTSPIGGIFADLVGRDEDGIADKATI
jgi:hypothetical protein